jgi:GrpB-like predicted nucleotidyltransferase (UPF0157 family)
VLKGSDSWVRHLAFRDYLRAHPETSADYYRLKCDLAMRCSKDEYTEAKGPFIERILASTRGHERQCAAQRRHAADGAARRR